MAFKNKRPAGETAERTEDGWICNRCRILVFSGCQCDHGEWGCRSCGEYTYPFYYSFEEGCQHCGSSDVFYCKLKIATKMNFEITGGVPEGYKATGYRIVKKGELYLVVGRERNYAMKWSATQESFVEVVILEKTKQADDKC